MSIGFPGTQVACSTAAFLSSQLLAGIVFGLPLSSSTGVPSLLSKVTAEYAR
jgi:hypothetical protein